MSSKLEILKQNLKITAQSKKILKKIQLTGNKLEGKIYYRHTQFAGGLKQRTAGEMKAKYPTQMIELAVKGMLPKNSLGRKMFGKLNVYAGAEHPHAAQKPEAYELRG